MFISYKGFNVYYEIVGNGSVPVVFLHGWGGSVDSFKFTTKYLNFCYKAIFIDFPPFGKSEMPQVELTIYDYALMVKKILSLNNITCPIIVGHSFGGRVSLILANKVNTRGLILTCSAGIKPKRTFKYYYKIIKHKICKKLKIKNKSGSKDYNSLPDNFKKTFINIVNAHLEKFAKKINSKTVLFWGEKDKETPIYMAKKLNKLIKNSTLIVNKNMGHFCYLENAGEFIKIINLMALN